MTPKQAADYATEMLAFIDDVYACQQCNSQNRNAVVYCDAHKAWLHEHSKVVWGSK